MQTTGGGDTCSQADQAWACLIDALAQPCCQQLQGLVLSQCNLGPAAAAALSKLLRAKSRSNLQQLRLAQCAGMGEVSLIGCSQFGDGGSIFSNTACVYR